MDGTETGWGRPAEPAPRWRALLDRARHGSRSEDHEPERPEEPPEIRQAPPSAGPPLPSRPLGAVDRRPYNPLEQRHAPPPEPRPRTPYERRPVNPLDRRDRRNGVESRPERPVTPLEPRPVNPLEPRHHRAAETYPQRPETEQPRGFFSPAVRPVAPPATSPAARPVMPPPTGPAARPVAPPPTSPAARPVTQPPVDRVPEEFNGYPPARAAASVGSAAVLPPPRTTPTSPAAARVEWRQARPDEELERVVGVLRRKLGGPRVLAFANPKGGVHKTTATVLAAATIGSVRGRGVLAWDDNELRGTLGLRAGSARHARTIRHLVADLLRIENMHGDELLRVLDEYLRHASDGSYDVLAGEENPRFAQRLDQGTVRRVMDLLRRTHEVICVDTGNNVESTNWQTVMQAADQLVVTTVPREDAAFTADWMLDLLDETGMADLVANAVTLISCPTPGKPPLLDDLVKHFKTRTRAVEIVPYDPALEMGSSIEYSDLQQETRQAWLRAASTIIEPFAE